MASVLHRELPKRLHCLTTLTVVAKLGVMEGIISSELDSESCGDFCGDFAFFWA